MKSPPRAVLGVGAGLAAAGLGAALGLAAERWTENRAVGAAPAQNYGGLRGLPMDVTASDGTRLYAEIEDGPGRTAEAAPLTIIFSHGFCLSQDIWHYQRQWLRDRNRMVFWDQRGHGRSGVGPIEHYTVEQCGRDLAAVIDATTPTGPIVLVGHSMGGMSMMALAAQQCESLHKRILAVALVATSPGGLADEPWGFANPVGQLAHRIAPRALSGLTRAPALVERTRRLGSDLERFLVKRYSYASPVPRSLVRFSAQLIADTPIDVVSAFLPDFDRHDRTAELAHWAHLEALVFSGDRDLLTPPGHSAEMMAQLPRAEQVLVPRAGHLVMLEYPEVLNVALADLLLRAEQSAAESTRRRWRPRRAH